MPDFPLANYQDVISAVAYAHDADADHMFLRIEVSGRVLNFRLSAAAFVELGREIQLGSGLN